MRRGRKRLLIALSVVLGLLLGVVVAGLLWLDSPSGEGFVKEKALDALKGAIAGRAEVGGLELHGSRLVLHDLKLFTPEGELVLEVKRLEGSAGVLALARSRLNLSDVSIEAPRLYLVQDERGLNLSRAIAAKAAAAPGGAPSALHLDVRGLHLTEGFLDYQSPEQRLTLDGLEVEGGADVVTVPLQVESELTVKGAVKRPLEAPLKLRLTTRSPSGGALELTTALEVGANRLEGRLSWPELAAKVSVLTVTPETARAFVPEWPLKVPLSVEGQVSMKEGSITGKADSATLSASGAWDTGKATVERFQVSLSGANLADLLVGGHPSRISFSAKGALSDARPETLTGHATVQGSWSALDSTPHATFNLAARAKEGVVHLEELLAQFPGAKLTGSGQASRQALDLSGHVEATDLSQVSALLAKLTGTTLPLGGHGAVDLTVSGSPAHPGAAAKGHLVSLKFGTVEAEAVDLDVQVPDLTRPVDADGVLSAKRLKVGEQSFDEVGAKLTTQGRQLDGELSMRGLANVSVVVSGLLDDDSQGLALAALSLRSPESQWTLEAPTHLRWPGSTVEIPGLALHAGPQRVAVKLKKVGSWIDGSLSVASVNLGTLPHAFVPPSLGLAGEVSGELKARGPLAKTEAEARLRWSNGSVHGITGIDAALEGTHHRQRTAGTLELSSSLGVVSAEFDVPIEAYFAGRNEDWRAKVAASKLDVTKLAAIAKTEVPATAVLSASLQLDGTTLNPKVVFALEAPNAEVKGELNGAVRVIALDHLKLAVFTHEGGKLGATVSTGALGGKVQATLESPFTIPGLRRGLPTAQQLREAEGALGVDLSGVDLKRAQSLGLELTSEDEELAGFVSMKASLHGNALAPRGDVTVTLSQAILHPLHHFDVTATVKATDDGTSLKVTSAVAGKPALSIDGQLSAPVERLASKLEDIGAHPVRINGTLAPIDLATLFQGTGTANVKGTAAASFEIAGTLDAPKLRAAGSVQGLELMKAALGSARFEWKGVPREQSLVLAVGGEGRADLKVRGTVGIDLSLAAVRKGLDVGSSPLALSVESRELDLGFLSGLTEELRVVGGRLTMQGEVNGTVALPRFKGDASLSNGHLALMGFGDYREIELRVHATNDLVELQRLSVRAGQGAAQLTATATRVTGADAFHLVGNGSLEKFPIVTDDQLVATASLKFDTEGELTSRELNLRSLKIPRVDVALPDVKRKNLQSLQRPDDIVVVRGGHTITPKGLKQARAKKDTHQAPGRIYRAVINAPRNIWLRSSDMNLEVGLSDNFRVELGEEAQLYGEVSVLRGRINVIGREFDVQRTSQLRFAGPADEPYVNVIALYTNTREKVTVTVSVVGRGTDVALKSTSDPPLSESDIYTLLATGRLELRRGSGASVTPEQAVSVVGNLAASELKQVLAKKLPIDVINFEATDNFQSMKLDIGKYLSDRVYLGYTFQPGAREDRGENAHAGRVEFQFSKNWALEAYAGTAPAAGADVMWSRDF